MRTVYYVTVGNNGGIVTDDYHHALLCKKYLRGHVYIRKFFDFEEAEDYLLDHVTGHQTDRRPLRGWDAKWPNLSKYIGEIFLIQVLSRKGGDKHGTGHLSEVCGHLWPRLYRT